MAQDEARFEGPITINIGNLCGGAAIEAFDLMLSEVLKNVVDPNTEARAKRYVNLSVMIKPKDDRTQLDVEFTCDAKLAQLRPTQSQMYVGKDEFGVLYALTEDPRQMNIFTPPKPVEAPQPIQFKSSGK